MGAPKLLDQRGPGLLQVQRAAGHRLVAAYGNAIEERFYERLC